MAATAVSAPRITPSSHTTSAIAARERYSGSYRGTAPATTSLRPGATMRMAAARNAVRRPRLWALSATEVDDTPWVRSAIAEPEPEPGIFTNSTRYDGA